MSRNRMIRVRVFSVSEPERKPGQPLSVSKVYDTKTSGGVFRVPSSSDAARQLSVFSNPQGVEMQLTVDSSGHVSSVATLTNNFPTRMPMLHDPKRKVVRVSSNYTSAISRMINAAGIRASVSGDDMQVWVTSSVEESLKVWKLLVQKGFRFTETKRTSPTVGSVFSVTSRVMV